MARRDHPSLGPPSSDPPRACKHCGIPTDGLHYCSDACMADAADVLLNRIRHFQARKRAALAAEEATEEATDHASTPSQEPARARHAYEIPRCFWCGTLKAVIEGARACPTCDLVGMWPRWEHRRGEFEGLLRWYEERPYDYERDGEADG